MDKIILGMTGLLAAGKTTVSQYLVKNHGASLYAFSTPLRDILDRVYLEHSRKNMQDLSSDLRETFSQDILSTTIAHDVEKDKNNIVIVEGVRRLSDIKHLRNLPGFKLINFTADQKTRWERLVAREQNPDDGDKTFEEFKQDEQAEAEQQIAEVASTAEFTIDNNGTVEEAKRQMEEILKKINEDKS